MNLGVAVARAPYLMRLDGHAIAPTNFVRRSLQVLLETGAACAGGVLKTVAAPTITGRAIAWAMSSRWGVGDAHFRVGASRREVNTVAFGIYYTAQIRALGGFDEKLERCQDDEFNLRLRLAGGSIVLDPGIVVTYQARDSLTLLRRQYFQYGFWKVRVFAKHRQLSALRAYVPMLLILSTMGGIALFALGAVRLGIGLLPPFSYATFLLGGLVSALRHRLRCSSFVVPFALAAMHLSYGSGMILGVMNLVREQIRSLPRITSTHGTSNEH
jgi:hypothetical protein